MFILSVHGVYDGKKLELLENINVQSPKKVIVTFLEEDDDLSSHQMHVMAQKGGAFDFLEEEELYSDKDLKKRYQ